MTHYPTPNLLTLYTTSLAGITYKTWVTSVTKSPGKFNTRTGLGGVSDRVGALAYALTPLSILLSSRESALSLLTGIPHTSFLFLHIWTGRIIFVQSFLHTLGWTIIEARLYQPQPTVYRDFMAQLYIVFGVVAMILVTVLYLFSLKRVVYWTGYQVFKLTHYITAILYLAACWIHWAPLACWMIASIILLVLDRGIRLARLALIHTGHLDKAQLLGFKKAQASIKLFTDADGAQVVRMEFEHTHGPWRPGQHFFLTFPGLAWWCAHPFTPALNARPHPQGQRHVYVVRVKEGITRKLAQVAIVGGGEGSTDVLLTGPYGVGFERRSRNMLGIAGGTGISFVFPIFLERLAARHGDGDDALIRLVWIVRKESDVQWFRHEIEKLKPTLANRKKKSSLDVSVMIIITRDRKPQTTRSSNDAIHITHTSEKNPEDLPLPPPAQDTHIEYLYLADHHPSPCALLDEFASSCSNGGSIDVVASGPSAMGRELKAAVARMNCGGKVWRGDRSASVRFVGDVREV